MSGSTGGIQPAHGTDLLSVVVDLDVLRLDPDDLSVFPGRHRIAQRFVKPPSISRSFPQRLVYSVSIFEQLIDP